MRPGVLSSIRFTWVGLLAGLAVALAQDGRGRGRGPGRGQPSVGFTALDANGDGVLDGRGAEMNFLRFDPFWRPWIPTAMA